MRIKPDKRHLVGGMVGAVLLVALLIYFGLDSPAEVYYHPAHSVHVVGNYGLSSCRECHEQAFAQPRSEMCDACHPGGARSKLAAATATTIPRNQKLPGAARDPYAQTKAAQQFHELVKAQPCAACHIEHKETELGAFLTVKPKERSAYRNYPENVHGFLPQEMRGEQFCTTCHEASEIEAGKRTNSTPVK